MSESSSERSRSPTPTKKKRKVKSLNNSDDDSDSGSTDQDALPPPDSTVLSHAEQRRQKKKQRQQRLAAVSSEPLRKKHKLDGGPVEASPSSNVHAKTMTMTKTVNTPAADGPRRQKRQNSVWVGNLAFRTTQDALRAFFDGVGKITRMHMPMKRGKQTQSENMGFAYVDFETPEGKVIAITLSEGQLDGRNLLIKDGGDFTGRPKTDASEVGEGDKPVKNTTTADGKGLSKTAQKILRVQKQPPAPTLFLGNLGFETTEESIRELFEAHRNWGRKGEEKKGAKEQEGDEDRDSDGAAMSKDVWIRKIRMGTFEDSGACKGFAFVDFTSVEHATTALVNPRNHRLNGRDLVVEYASPEAVRRGSGPRNPNGTQDQTSKKGGSRTQQTLTPYAKQHRSPRVEQEDSQATTTRSNPPDRTGHRPHTRRAKPGAALAHAQRQSAAILPSQNQKIVF